MGKTLNRRDHTIATQHISAFLLLIALPTLIVILLSGFLFRREIVRITTEQRLTTLEQTAASLDSGIQDFSLIASALIHDRTLMETSLEYAASRSADQRYRISTLLDNIFNRYFILTKQLGSFYVFFRDGSGPYICRNYAGLQFTRGEMDAIIEEGKKNPGFVQILDSVKPGAEFSMDRPVLSLVINTVEERKCRTGIGTLLLSFDLGTVSDFIEPRNTGSRDGGKFYSVSFLVGRAGTVLSSSEESFEGLPFDEVKSRLGRQYLIIEKSVETPRWIIVEAINIHSLTQNIDRYTVYGYIALALIVCLFLWYNTIFFGQMVLPLKVLARKMETVARGNFSARVDPCEFQELNKLGNAFNLMVAEIDSLTTAIKDEQKERIKAEIEALRYQLNPHFLCNTLNAIRMMASITKNDAIKKMTQALMTITEDNLGRDDTVYSLCRELKNIDSYVYIMKVRYGDGFDFYKDVDTSLLQLGVPSMILQPIVENAILHGLHGLSRPGSITVAASRTDDSLKLEVRDNGFGMTHERVERLFEASTPADRGLNRIGLYNVKRRIVLLYGDKCDVEVWSYPDEGTAVSITLPILEPSDTRERYDDACAASTRQEVS